MIITSIHVENFRSILDETLPCENLTALVGPNGAGKSTFLRALRAFFEQSPAITVDDFYNRNTEREIIIAVTFGQLSEKETQHFQKYIEGETLTVERVFSCKDGKITDSIHGAKLKNPDFEIVRSQPDATKVKNQYKALRESTYQELEAASSQKAVNEALEAWEESNPGRCVKMRDDGNFFGFRAVGRSYLDAAACFIFIPAVRNASEDAEDGRGSVISALMDLLVRKSLNENEEVAALKEKLQQQYDEVLGQDKFEEVGNLERDLSSSLKTYVPRADVKLKWDTSIGIDFKLPKANLKLVEDNYETEVDRVGHGLQRAFIITLLQHFAMVKSPCITEESEEQQAEEANTTRSFPDLILAIEEPELFQHPSRQRHFANILLRLSNGTISGLSSKAQVIYATHSPLFVGIDRFNQIRRFQKETRGGSDPDITRLIYANLDEIAEVLWDICGRPNPKYTADTLLPRLHALMTPWMNEGFFADIVVLVEGEDDRVALLATALSRGIDLECEGISVIPCFGKESIDRPALIFGALRIPTYIVWDGDKGGRNPNTKANRRLLRLVGTKEEDYPNAIDDAYACFETDLETTLKAEIGSSIYEQILAEEQEAMGIPNREQAIKNPTVLAGVLRKARTQGHSSPSLEMIVDKVIARKEASQAEESGMAPSATEPANASP